MKKTLSPSAQASAKPTNLQVAPAADWHPSVYGADDEIGAANLLTPEIALQAVGLSKTGKDQSISCACRQKSAGIPSPKLPVI